MKDPRAAQFDTSDLLKVLFAMISCTPAGKVAIPKHVLNKIPDNWMDLLEVVDLADKYLLVIKDRAHKKIIHPASRILLPTGRT